MVATIILAANGKDAKIDGDFQVGDWASDAGL